MHMSALLEPATIEYVPAAQSMHALDPFMTLYFPGIHWTHLRKAEAFPPLIDSFVNPGLQIQSIESGLPGRDVEFGGQELHSIRSTDPDLFRYLPTSQRLHGSDPFVSLKVPGGHISHGPPFIPEKPLLHKQSSRSSLPDDESESGGHTSHAIDPADE